MKPGQNPDDKLTAKEELFAQALAYTGSKADAYRQAYSTDKMTGHSIRNEAQQVSKRPRVAARVEELRAKFRKKMEVDAAWVIAEILKRAGVTIPDVMSWEDGVLRVKNFSDLSEAERAAIKKLKYTRERGLEVELYDCERLLRDLGEHVGVWDKTVRLDDTPGLGLVLHIGHTMVDEGSGEKEDDDD